MKDRGWKECWRYECFSLIVNNIIVNENLSWQGVDSPLDLILVVKVKIFFMEDY